MKEDSGFRGPGRTEVVVTGNGVQQLRERGRLEVVRTLLDQTKSQVDVAEQPTLVRRAERGAAAKLDDATDIVEERGRYEQVDAQARVQLSGLTRQSRDPHRVLEQPTRVAVVALGRRGQLAQARAHGRVVDEPRSSFSDFRWRGRRISYVASRPEN